MELYRLTQVISTIYCPAWLAGRLNRFEVSARASDCAYLSEGWFVPTCGDITFLLMLTDHGSLHSLQCGDTSQP